MIPEHPRWDCLTAVETTSFLDGRLSWNVRPQRVRSPFRAVIGATVLLLLVATHHYALSPLYRGGFITDLWTTAVAVAGICALGVWVCLRLPHQDTAGWLDMVPGALVMAVGLEGLRWFTAIYQAGRLTTVNDLYGAIGVSAVFMAFLYLVARFAIVGLAINAEFWRQRNNR